MLINDQILEEFFQLLTYLQLDYSIDNVFSNNDYKFLIQEEKKNYKNVLEINNNIENMEELLKLLKLPQNLCSNEKVLEKTNFFQLVWGILCHFNVYKDFFIKTIPNNNIIDFSIKKYFGYEDQSFVIYKAPIQLFMKKQSDELSSLIIQRLYYSFKITGNNYLHYYFDLISPYLQ